MANRFTRWLHAGFAALFAAGVVVQAYLAGAALVQLGGGGDFGTHIEFGYTGMGILALGVLVTAFAARVPRSQVGLAVGLFVLYIVQTVLPNFRGSSPVVAALHPANALLLFGLAVVTTRRAVRLTAIEVPAAEMR